MRATGRPPTAQLVLLELAAAAVAGGLALGRGYTIAGIALAVILAVLAVGRRHRRWCYQLLVSWLGLVRRRRSTARAQSLAAVLGGYQVESVPGGHSAPTLGVVRSGTTWCVPLLLGLDDVLNEDPPVPVRTLADLLTVEDIPLASVRLLTITTPARVVAHAPSSAAPRVDQLAARYLLLSVDTVQAAEAVAARGGSAAAVAQMLRRCAIAAEQELANAGVAVRRLDEVAVAGLFAACLGPAAPQTGRRARRAVETAADVRVAGTWSTAVTVTGRAPGVVERAQRLAAAAPTPLAATSLVLLPDGRSGYRATLALRVSAPETAPEPGAVRALASLAHGLELTLQRAVAEQVPLLSATMPVGVAGPVLRRSVARTPTAVPTRARREQPVDRPRPDEQPEPVGARR